MSNYCSLKLRGASLITPALTKLSLLPPPPCRCGRLRLPKQTRDAGIKEGAKSTMNKNRSVKEPGKHRNICSAGQRLSSSSVRVHGCSQTDRARANKTCFLLLFATKVKTHLQRIDSGTLVFGSFCFSTALRTWFPDWFLSEDTQDQQLFPGTLFCGALTGLPGAPAEKPI